MTNETTTTIVLKASVRDWLATLKIHPYQPLGEILERLQKYHSKEKDLKDKLNGIKI